MSDSVVRGLRPSEKLDVSIFKNFAISAFPNKIVFSDYTIRNMEIELILSKLIIIDTAKLNVWLKVLNMFYFDKEKDKNLVTKIQHENISIDCYEKINNLF